MSQAPSDHEQNPPSNSNFRLECKYVALTYPRCDRLDEESLYSFLTSGLGKNPDYALLAREQHKDGGRHYHALLYWIDGIRTRKSRYFDHDGFHPNVQPARVPKDWYRYCTKEPNYREFGVLPSKLSPKAGDWESVLAKASTQDEFFERVRISYPRDWILFNDRITSYAQKYFQGKDAYVSNPAWKFEEPVELTEWRRQNLEEVSTPAFTIRKRSYLI